MEELAHHFHGAFAMATHAVTTPVFWLAFLGVALAWFLYMKRPDIPEAIKARCGFLYTLLDNKYYFDKFNEVIFAGGARLLGRGLWKGGDAGLIDGIIVNGAVRLVGWFATLATSVPDGSHLPLRFYDDYRRVHLDDPVGHARLS
jgi:NADH-quinone oxidoreductase subunit L